MAKFPVIAAAVAIGAALLLSTPVRAIEQVIDNAAIAKLAEQLNAMQKQIDALTQIVAATRQQANAIGRAGQINIPMVNLGRVTSRLRQDAQCLMPNMNRLMPGVEFDDQSIGSICAASNTYQKALWVDPQKTTGQPWAKREDLIRQVETRRTNLGVDVASKAIGQADTAARGGEDMNKAAAELEAAVAAAKESNEWLASIAQGQVLIARALIQQTQIQTSLLKVQGTWMALTALPPQSVLAASEQEGGQ